MKSVKPTSVEDFKLISSYQSVRKTLLSDKYQSHLEKPLAYWALPNDRRLPLAFLGRTLGDLLNTPFEELTNTPGIGQKKISSLVLLLHRATQDSPLEAPFGISELAATQAPAPTRSQKNGAHFDPNVVSESLWVTWRDTVSRHNVGYLTLGRVAPTLQKLPTVIWNTPLSYYLNYTLAEIRELKTHGEKRVRAILEVFWGIDHVLGEAHTQDYLRVSLQPEFIPPIESWVQEVLTREEIPTTEEIRNRLALPLLKQLKTDVGETIHKLAEGRLGAKGSLQSVRTQSRKLGVTRARVYQLLEECAKVMAVRWPQGRRGLNELAEHFEKLGGKEEDLELFNSTRELFYPEKLAGVDLATESED